MIVEIVWRFFCLFIRQLPSNIFSFLYFVKTHTFVLNSDYVSITY